MKAVKKSATRTADGGWNGEAYEGGKESKVELWTKERRRLRLPRGEKRGKTRAAMGHTGVGGGVGRLTG